MFPLPISSVIFRAPSEEAGRKWMEAIELSLKYSNLLVHKHIPSNRRDSNSNLPLSPNNIAINSLNNNSPATFATAVNLMNSLDRSDDEFINNQSSINDLDIEKHFGIIIFLL